jgi:hypothetical protein
VVTQQQQQLPSPKGKAALGKCTFARSDCVLETVWTSEPKSGEGNKEHFSFRGAPRRYAAVSRRRRRRRHRLVLVVLWLFRRLEEGTRCCCCCEGDFRLKCLRMRTAKERDSSSSSSSSSKKGTARKTEHHRRRCDAPTVGRARRDVHSSSDLDSPDGSVALGLACGW